MKLRFRKQQIPIEKYCSRCYKKVKGCSIFLLKWRRFDIKQYLIIYLPMYLFCVCSKIKEFLKKRKFIKHTKIENNVWFTKGRWPKLFCNYIQCHTILTVSPIPSVNDIKTKKHSQCTCNKNQNFANPF